MLKFVTAALALSLALAACNTMEPVVTDNANVRVAHLSPNTPNVDVFLDGRLLPALTNVPFKAVSGYLKIPVGPHDIAIFPTGKTTNPAIELKNITLEKKNYTIGAVGLLSGTGAQALKANVYVDDLTTIAGKARVRVIHASPDAPAVDVGVKGGTPAEAVVKGITFPNATGYLELAPGSLPLEIRAAGASAAVFSFNTPSLAAGKVYTVFAVGRLGTAGEFGVVAVGDSLEPPVVENANVRVAHLSPNTPAVDIWLDGKVVDSLKNVTFKAVSPYLKIPVGKHDIAVYVAGTTTNPAIEVKGLDLENKSYTVGAIGLLSGTGAQALTAKVYVDDLTSNAAKARVRVIHASPDAPAVDVGLKGGTPAAAVVKNITFPNATSGYLELDAGVLDLEIRPTGTTTVAFGFKTPALEVGKVYTVFAVGRLGTAGEFGVVPVGDAAAK